MKREEGRIKKKIRGLLESLFVISLLVAILTGCHLPFYKAPDIKSYLAETRDQKWINDITYLEKILPKAHPNLYFQKSETDFVDKLEALKKEVPNLSDEEINITMSQIVSNMGDTHTNLNISVDKVYPLQFYWYDEGLYVTDTSKAYQELLFSKVTHVNGKPIEEVGNAFKVFFAGANEQWFRNQVVYYFPSESLLKYLHIIEDEKVTWRFEKLDGTCKEVVMEPVSGEDITPIEDESIYKHPLYKQHPYENYWYEYLPEEKIMYVNFKSANEMMEEPFTIFTDEVFKVIEENEVDKLVIDIRENQGGSDHVFKPFLKKLKKCKLNHEGQLFVVMGRKTYSAGLNTVIALKQKTCATLVGENSGGKPNHYGDTRYFKLPNSKLTVTYSTKYIKKMKQDLSYLVPDVTIYPSVEAEREGKDNVLSWIIKQ